MSNNSSAKYYQNKERLRRKSHEKCQILFKE